MNLEKVVFGFFIVLALTLNVAFVAGDIDNQIHHDIWLLFAAVVVNLIATVLKFGDRSQAGALLLAAALVADLQLLVSALIWSFADAATGLSAATTVTIVSLAYGALVANVVSVILLVSETLITGR